MTRRELSRTLLKTYVVLFAVLSLSLGAKLADQIPGLSGTPLAAMAGGLYEYLRDMALVIITVVAAYLANVFQKRSKFIESLEEEWRGIVRTKSALFAYCETPNPAPEAYVQAFCRISETLDNMRIVYRNVGETDTLVGLYPYAPLHDMRRALQSIDPRKGRVISDEERKLARDAILQCFYALRETFLEELELGEPDRPLLIHSARRRKSPGSTARSQAARDRQRSRQNTAPGGRADIDALLARLYDEENVAYPTPDRRKT
ncbi:MAG: hypothetical protein NW216_06825 [Hyphomicrobium sp.]|nr:hypothetical protein [Hyphomicrobium sp.]